MSTIQQQSSAASGAAPQKTVLVSGEQGDSVGVQSQLATSHVAGDVTSKSNIGQVVTDLGNLHTTSGAWLDGETAKISQWGQKEIQRVLEQTKKMEEALVLGAKEKQKALDASHSGELAKLVQEMDLRKAAELKELEDGLQRQIQAALSASKKDINDVESKMNAKKMELLKQSQLKSAKEIDVLSNLVVETKLVPSQTRTVIETNTDTGNLIAVATGGNISTGSAVAAQHNSQQIAAIPNAGELRQASDVTRGDMIEDATGRKVGEGAIHNTMTGVREQPALAAGQGQQGDVTVTARPLQGGAVGGAAGSGAIAHREQPIAPTTTKRHADMSGLLSQEEIARRNAANPSAVVDRSGALAHDGTMPARAIVNPEPTAIAHQQGQAHGATQLPGQSQLPLDHGREAGSSPMIGQQHGSKVDPTLSKPYEARVDQAYGKHSTDVPAATEQHRVEHGIMGKVKHALGMDKHHASEPTSTDATAKRV